MTDASKVTLIITNSTDVTTDVLIRHTPAPSARYFRYNFDLADHYALWIVPGDFGITDPLGRVCTLNTVAKAYYRKPARVERDDPEARYVQSELWYALKTLINLLWQKRKLVLVEPYVEAARLDKFTQISAARTFFNVPETLFSFHDSGKFPASQPIIVKSLSGARLGNRTIFSTRAEASALHPLYPWCVQHYIEAAFDLTVVYVQGDLFAFRLRRDFLETGVDWRKHESARDEMAWQSTRLSPALETTIRDYMTLLRLDYGRLDFLESASGELYFLEVNPNGQFAWLDLENRAGLIGRVTQAISPDTELRPIPNNPF